MDYQTSWSRKDISIKDCNKRPVTFGQVAFDQVAFGQVALLLFYYICMKKMTGQSRLFQKISIISYKYKSKKSQLKYLLVFCNRLPNEAAAAKT
jgi:hypothetical protein